MDAATSERLRRGAEELGAPLSESQLDRFARYLSLLQKWNRKINLTAIEISGADLGGTSRSRNLR